MKHSIRTLAALGLLAGMAGPALLSAEEDADMRVWKESVNERLKALHNDAVDFNKVRFEAFSDIRFDDVRNLTNTAGNSSGIYNRRSEAKFFGLLTPNVTYSLGFDFPDAKLKDLGLEIRELPLIPFVETGQTWSLRIGQYRIPFGIVPQTSSSDISLPERPYIFGGAGQLAGTKLVGERVMGLQGRHNAKLGFISTVAQFGAFNNASQDASRNGGTLAVQYSSQVTDNDLSWVGRFAFDWNFLAGLLPEKSKLTTGASYIRDSQNAVYIAQNAVQQMYDEIYGVEGKLALGSQITLQGEWVREMDSINGLNGLTGQREGWYGDLIVNILPWIASEIEKDDKLEMIFRLEDQMDFAAFTSTKKSRIGGGIKWSYWGGKNHTSVTYLVEGYNQNFGQAVTNNIAANTLGGPFTTLIVQQQFAFNNGKPRFMEEEAE